MLAICIMVFYNTLAEENGVWRSLVSRMVRDHEAAGSSPATPTNLEVLESIEFSGLLLLSLVFCVYRIVFLSANNPADIAAYFLQLFDAAPVLVFDYFELFWYYCP